MRSVGWCALRRRGRGLMVHVGLDLSRRRVDVCVLSHEGELVEELAAPPDAGGLRYLVSKLARHREPVRAVIESRRHSSSDRLTVLLELRPRSRPPMSPGPPRGGYREMS